MMQLTLPYVENESEDEGKRQAIRERLSLLQRAAEACGISWNSHDGQGEVACRILRALGHLCGSITQANRGVVGLRWAGPWTELAEDKMVTASRDHVRKVAKKLADELGLISIVEIKNRKGQDAGVMIGLEMSRINALAGTQNHPLHHPGNHRVLHPGNHRVLHPGAIGLSYTVKTEEPKTPPPSERALPVSASPAGAPIDSAITRAASSGSVVVANESSTPTTESNRRTAADFEIDSARQPHAAFQRLVAAFESIKLDRAVPAAREFAHRESEAIEAIETYRRQASKFREPGAVVIYLRDGAWPVRGIKSLEELRDLERRRKAREREAAIERDRCERTRREPLPDFTAAEIESFLASGAPIDLIKPFFPPGFSIPSPTKSVQS